MLIKAVLFDMFDTLMMIEEDHAFHAPSLRSAYDFLISNGVKVDYMIFEKAYIKARDELYTQAEAKLEEPHFDARITNALRELGLAHQVSSKLISGATNAFCEAFMKYVRIDKNAMVVLQRLRLHFRLGIVSNFAIPECVVKLLEREGLDSFFDVVVVSGAVNRRKPSPEIFSKALEALAVNAEEAVFVGDTVDADIEGAANSGMKTVFIERRKQKKAKSVCPTKTIKSLSQLPTALEIL